MRRRTPHFPYGTDDYDDQPLRFFLPVYDQPLPTDMRPPWPSSTLPATPGPPFSSSLSLFFQQPPRGGNCVYATATRRGEMVATLLPTMLVSVHVATPFVTDDMSVDDDTPRRLDASYI